MVSTQNPIFTPAGLGYTSILGTTAIGRAPVERVLTRAPITHTPPPPSALDSHNIAKLIDHVKADSEAVFSGLSYAGTQPKSVAHLMEMGAKRNENATTEKGKPIDQTAAFHNDVAYFKALLAAREKHREAMRAKLQALHTLRTRQKKMYRKSKSGKATAQIVATALSRAANAQNNISEQPVSKEEKWHTPPCASPVSTDVEPDEYSDFGDADVGDEKPVVKG